MAAAMRSGRSVRRRSRILHGTAFTEYDVLIAEEVAGLEFDLCAVHSMVIAPNISRRLFQRPVRL